MSRTALVHRSIALISLLAATSMDSTCGAEEPNGDLAAKLAEVCRKHNVPAMAAAVVDASGAVKSQCFGNRKRGTADKVELSDRFPIGSCTKSTTATLAAVMVDAGKIDWDTSIGDVWPKATGVDIHPKLRAVTLDELLSHQSGLSKDITGQQWASFFKESESPELERRRMLKTVLAVSAGLGPALIHAGSNTNSFALVWVLPKSNFAAVVCTNTGQPQAFPACDEMMSHLIAKFSSGAAVK